MEAVQVIRTSATTSVPKPTSGLLSERSTQPLGGVKQALLSDTLSSSDSQSQLPSKRGRLFSALKPSQHQPAADLEQAAHDTASAENGASLSSQHEPAADLDQAPRLNVKRRTSRLSFSTDFDHPPAKKYQYFLSHKKSHSELGLVPGQVAKNFHDSLELLGHVGWMDVDNLGKINQGELRAAIAECASMLVILNDETPDSEWCRFEWKMAQEFDVPVKVIVDMELCSKKRALSLLTELRHENMLRYSLLEYTERYRRDTLAALSQFLHDVAPLDKHGKLQKPKRSWRSARSSYSDPLMFGQEDSVEQHVLHPLYETYTLVGGAPARPPTSGVWLAYVYLANSSSAICALTWLLGVFLLPEGSDVFVSYHVEVTSALWMCCIPQLSASMMRLLRSEDMMRVLEMIEQQQTGEELSKSLHRNSGRAAKLGFQFAAVFQAMVIAIVVCMFADPQYMGEGVPSWVQCVSMSSIAVFSTLFAMTVVSAVSGASQHGLIHSISRIQLFTALDKLHPRIAEIGMHRFAQTASHSTLDLDHEDMIAFERRWVEGLTAFQLIQAELAPSEQVWLGACVLACSIPLDLWYRGVPVAGRWPVIAKLVWCTLGCGFFFIDIIRSGHSVTRGLRQLEADTKKLIFTRPIDRIYLSTIISQDTDLTVYCAGFLPCTAFWTTAVVWLILASLLPLFFLNYV